MENTRAKFIQYLCKVFFCVSFFFIISEKSISQVIKTYKGSLTDFNDEYLGAVFSTEIPGTAEFSYYLDANEQMVKQGKFIALKSLTSTISNQSFGYAGYASGTSVGRVTGEYKNNLKVGLWKYQKMEFGMAMGGSSFDFFNWNWNSLSIDNSKKIESIRTITVTYVNGLPEGDMEDVVVENGKKILSLHCTMHNGHYEGKYIGESFHLGYSKIVGNFDNNGFFDGNWITQEKYSSDSKSYLFSHGVLLNYISHDKNTGVKTSEQINPILNILSHNNLNAGSGILSEIKIDTVDIIYKDGRQYGIKTSNNDTLLYIELSNIVSKGKSTKSESYEVILDNASTIRLNNFVTYNSIPAAFVKQELIKSNRELIFVCKGFKYYDSVKNSIDNNQLLQLVNNGFEDFPQVQGVPYINQSHILFADSIRKSLILTLNNIGYIKRNKENYYEINKDKVIYRGSNNMNYLSNFIAYRKTLWDLDEIVLKYSEFLKFYTNYLTYLKNYDKKQNDLGRNKFFLEEFLNDKMNAFDKSQNRIDLISKNYKILDSLTNEFSYKKPSIENEILYYLNNKKWDILNTMFRTTSNSKYILEEDDVSESKLNNFEYIIKLFQNIKSNSFKIIDTSTNGKNTKGIKISFLSQDSSLYYLFINIGGQVSEHTELVDLFEVKIINENISKLTNDEKEVRYFNINRWDKVLANNPLSNKCTFIFDEEPSFEVANLVGAQRFLKQNIEKLHGHNFIFNEVSYPDSLSKILKINFNSSDNTKYNIKLVYKKNFNWELKEIWVIKNSLDINNPFLWYFNFNKFSIEKNKIIQENKRLNISEINSNFVLIFSLNPNDIIWYDPYKNGSVHEIEKILKEVSRKIGDDKIKIVSLTNIRSKSFYPLLENIQSQLKFHFGHLLRLENDNIFFDKLISLLGLSENITVFNTINVQNDVGLNRLGRFSLLDLKEHKFYNNIPPTNLKEEIIKLISK